MTSTSETGRRAPLTRLHRQWRDLRAWRLCFGLCLGPVAIAIIYFLIELFAMGATDEFVLYSTIGILVFGMVWSMIAGWVYLLAVVRPRRKISRIECLLLGVVNTVFLPLAIMALVFAVDGQARFDDVYGNAPFNASFFLGLLVVSLFGLLGGWLFWRFGVRPAPMPAPDVTAVFD